MKLLLTLLISSMLLADSIHNFKTVSFYGKTLDNVQLVLDDENSGVMSFKKLKKG